MDVRGLVLLGCLTGAIAAPTSSSRQCDLKCIAPSGFDEGRTYVYTYHTETSTFLQQEAYGYSNLTINCEARLEVLGNCEIVLELRDVSAQETNRDGEIIASPNEESFREHLTRNRLRFGMQAGKVTSVCPSSGDAVWVNNFKRGVLSAVQLTQPTIVPGTETITESTVSGKCPTVITSEEEGRLLKLKDFMKCEGRYNMDAIIPGIKLFPYAPSTGAITSEQYCRQEHNNNYITFSECREKHMLYPIADPPTGPITVVSQTLTFDTIVKAPSNHALEPVQERETILYVQHEHTEEEKTDATRASELVSDLCESLANGVDTDSAKHYTAVIHEIRRLDSTTLAGVLASATCEGYQTSLEQILGDALRDCQSSGCVEIMVNLIQDNTVQDEKIINNWISSLSFVNHPTKEMVAHLMELKDTHNMRNQLFLTVTTIIKNYCTHVNSDCKRESEISHALDFFEDSLRLKCRYRDNVEKSKMMAALHALGNAGVYRQSIRKCYESEGADIALRVAAIQAAQEMPCQHQNQDGLINILEKTSQDSELRITAYRALMSCPSQSILDTIDALLEDEMSNQVGGYIVSHMKNIQASEDPLKAEQRALLQDHPITAKFLEDTTKFSHNAEWSWYNDTTGYGIGGEGDVIFSSNSFIPRQIAVKGQFDAFGYAFEAFELGGRMEGLQGLLESAFTSRNDGGDARERRSLIKENKLNKVIDDFEITGEGEAGGHVYLKMFGNKVLFLDADDIKEMLTPKTTEDYITTIAMLAMGQTYEVSKGALVSEHRMSVPLVNGLELKVSVNTSVMERLKATGRVNMLGLVMEPRSFEISGTIEPSASIDMSCLMEVDAHCARIGGNYELSAHTATSLSGKISFEDGKNLKLQLNAPEQKQEILSVNSRIFFLHQEEMDFIPMSSLDLMQEEICTGDYLEEAFGIRICGDSKYHVTELGSSPLSGVYEFSLTAEKVEADLTSFDIDVSYSLDKKMVAEETEKTDNFHLMFGTPNTQRQRTYELDWSFNRLSREFRADFTCPHHVSRLEATSIKEDNHHRLQVTWTINQDSVYSMYLNFEKSITEDGSNYYPTMRISTPQFGTLQLLGSVIHTPAVVQLDISFQGETRKLITINGDITKVISNRKSRYDADLAIGGEYLVGSIVSGVQVRDGLITVDATLSKEALFGGDRSLTIAAKHNVRGSGDINQDFYVSCEFSNSPELNFHFDGEVEGQGLNSESNFKFCYGQTTCNGNQKIILTHVMNVENMADSLTNHFTMTLQHPNQGTHLILSQSLACEDGRKDFDIKVTDKQPSPPVVLVGSHLGLIHERTDSEKFGSFEVSLNTPGSVKRLNQTWNRQSSDVSATTTVQWQEDKQLVASTSYSKTGDSEDSVNVIITLPDRSTRGINFSLVGTKSEKIVQLTMSSDDESVFFVEGRGSLKTKDGSGGDGSLTVNTPSNVLSDFKLAFLLNKYDGVDFDSVLSFTLLPDGNTYSLRVEQETFMSESISKIDRRVTVASPFTTGALHGFVHRREDGRKGGLSLSLLTEGLDERIFGIEAKVTDRSEGSTKDIVIRVNTTAPYHQNSIEVSARSEEANFDYNLDIEYFSGIHLTTSISMEKKPIDGGFILKTFLNAPYQRSTLILDHTTVKGRLFNPHLTIEVASFEFDMTLLDLNLGVTTEETVHGKEHQLSLHLSGPGKTLILTTGIVRRADGFNYFVQLSNPDEVRFRVDLDTSIQVENNFMTHIGLTASSIYAPEWPIDCGIDMHQSADDVGVIIFFNVNEDPLFHFNITKSVSMELSRENIGVRVKLPRSVIPSLHHFGMHILKEESLSYPDELPLKSGSLSFFWGPEANQQLTISSVSSVQRRDDNVVIEGSVMLAQPLRTIHLNPEYTLDYIVSKAGPQVNITVEYDHGNSDSSIIKIIHSEQEKKGNPNYITSATATLQEGKMFRVTSDITCGQDEHIVANLVFTMDNGDMHENAQLIFDATKLTEDGLDRTFDLSFEHSPSGFDLSSTLSVTNNDAAMYFGLEGQCQVPDLDGPVDLGIEIQLDKNTKELLFHGLGPVNDIIIKGNIFNLTSDSINRYRLETANEINGVKRPVNFQLNFKKQLLDVIFETNGGEHKLHTSYLNDSSIQTTLTNDDVVNAQHTVAIWNPHTLYNLITWEPTWPATIKDAARERIDAMKQTRRETLERYQEIGRVIREGFSSYMERSTMRNEELIQRLAEVREGIEERLFEIQENYQMHRETIRNKFEDFAATSRSNLSPLVEEYEEMMASSGSKLVLVREHVSDATTAYFEGARRALNAYALSIVGVVAAECMDIQDILQENLELNREAIAALKIEKKEAFTEWSETELNWMRSVWAEAKEDVKSRWEEFAEIMSGMIKYDELDDMLLAYQLSPMFRDSASLGNTIMDVQTDVVDRLETMREEAERTRALKERDAEALRRIMHNFNIVKNAPTFATREMQIQPLDNFFDCARAELKDKIGRLQEWAVDQSKGYKYLGNIEEGKIEIWLYTDERYDDLVSPPVNDPFGSMKVLGLRLSEDFPLIEEARQLKADLYNDAELVMEYFEIAENSFYQSSMQTNSGTELWDLWEWNGFINTALYDMFGNRCPKGQAILLGDQHYKTFDGTYYVYAGKCSFILAQDFVDDNFTIAVEYGRDEDVMSKSFTVLVDGNTFEIKDGRVYADDNVCELPYSMETVQITRDYSNIYITSSKGFTATYDLIHDIFKVQLSLFYFGKTAGLFGNFNYESHDDLVKVTGTTTPRVDEFARSWEIGKKCETHLDKSVICDDSPSFKENIPCAGMFLDGLGPASAGHPAVEPEHFYRACINSACGHLSAEELREKRCSVFQAYIEACKHEGLVWLSMPEECVMCEVSEEESFSSDNYYVNVPNGVDVVVILEQGACMSEQSQNFGNLIRMINTQLHGEGLRDNRFGIVGFGGAGMDNDPHFVTINGELYSTAETLTFRLNDMEFGDGMGDAWGAIKFAMGYPFRAGVAKHIILMSCSECVQMSRFAGSHHVQKAMNDIGITFSVLTSQSLSLGKYEAKEQNKLYGYDEARIYTNKLAGVSTDSFKGDRATRQFLDQPGNPCTKLAMATEGSVFDTNFIRTKDFRDVFALWVVKQSKRSETASCNCSQQTSAVPQSTCTYFG